MLIDVIVILMLVLANGIFSGAEMAIVASRRGRLRSMADAGDAAARTALDLASNPDRFLPTVQVGVTLVGTLAAAYGGERMVDSLAAWLAAIWPGLAGVAHPAARLFAPLCGAAQTGRVARLLGPRARGAAAAL